MREFRISIGFRIFVVEEDAVLPISQKTFTGWYSGKVRALPKAESNIFTFLHFHVILNFL
jgi:hypothetical protein